MLFRSVAYKSKLEREVKRRRALAKSKDDERLPAMAAYFRLPPELLTYGCVRGLLTSTLDSEDYLAALRVRGEKKQ